MGRAILPINKRKDFKVHVRLTEEQYLQIKAQNYNISAYLRKLILEDIKKKC